MSTSLIELKFTGTEKGTLDLADVVELIAVRQLDGSFARFLHKSVRETFRELVRNARGQS